MMRRSLRWLRRLALVLLAVPLVGLVWLRVESHLPQDAYMDARRGTLAGVETTVDRASSGSVTESVRLTSDSGLALFLRVLRQDQNSAAGPALIILGGHRTGRDAVDLFTAVTSYAVVALDYPYDGPERVRGAAQVIDALPKARRAFLDTPPAVSLALDWLEGQSWFDGTSVIVGASLGVPFAAKAAARDHRIDAAILVHGAADNERWLTHQVARRVDAAWLHAPLGTLLHWLAYGPSFNTGAHVAAIAPRPTLIIGAKQDERTPPDEVSAMFDAARAPKRLRWTSGRHIEPDRLDVIDEMMRIAADEWPFLVRHLQYQHAPDTP